MDYIYEFFRKNKIFSIVIGVFLITIIILLITLNNKPNNINKDNISLRLFGSSKITLSYGEEYIEPGFYAISSDGLVKTNEVIVDGSVDSLKPGIYIITYRIGNEYLKREIEILDDKDSLIYLSLKGNSVINLGLNKEYIEPGIIAKNRDDVDVSNLVKVSGIVDTYNEGTYTITYSIQYKGIKKAITRTVIVEDTSLNINVSLSNTSYTNESVEATVVVTGKKFLRLMLPNKVIKTDKISTFTITKNGEYKFIAYNELGEEFEKIITVSNIDKTNPSVKCNATINLKSTSINVSANDLESGINEYIYYDSGVKISNTSMNYINYNEKTSKNVMVKVYDKAGNFTNTNCEIIDKSYLEPIRPNGSENIIKQSETDTLKVYITKKSNYYITRIWAYDPYKQLNKFDSPEYGKNLYRPKALLEKARDKYSLNNKLIIGFNASGFYLADTYDASSVSKYSKYNKTSVGTLVITNGKVVRNAYNKAYKTWFITGIDKDNNLRIFKDAAGTSASQIETKKKWAEEVINSGIRNTFTFAAPLIVDGKESTTATSMPSTSSRVNRQAICQVNNNNFILITGKELNRSDLILIMKSLNCRTGTNLDGGGSIALLYKNKNSNSIETIIGNGRNLTEVGYFTE